MRDRLVNAQTIAILCQQIPIDEAADLIEDYARMRASEATAAAAAVTANTMLRLMGNTELLIAPGA